MAGAPQPSALHPGHAPHAGGLRPLRLHVLPRGTGARDDESATRTGPRRMPAPPMLPPAFIEAGCGRCHLEERVTRRQSLSRGRALMARAGCYACHAVRGQEDFRSEAPPLATIPLKTGGEWLQRWLKDPKTIDPNATMPNFQLTDKDDRRALALPLRRPGSAGARRADRSGGGRAAGQLRQRQDARLRSRRCITCHTVDGKGTRLGARALQDRLHARRGAGCIAFLRESARFQPATQMPRYSLQRGRIVRDVVAYSRGRATATSTPRRRSSSRFA